MESEDPILSDEPGRQLRDLRLAREISQRHLAELSGVDQSLLSRLERGDGARLATWKSLFSALGYEIVLRAEKYADEESDGLLEDQKQRRKDRMEEGRASRWG